MPSRIKAIADWIVEAPGTRSSVLVGAAFTVMIYVVRYKYWGIALEPKEALGLFAVITSVVWLAAISLRKWFK